MIEVPVTCSQLKKLNALPSNRIFHRRRQCYLNQTKGALCILMQSLFNYDFLHFLYTISHQNLECC